MGAALIFESGYRTIGMDIGDQSITARLAKKDQSAFEQVFKTYYQNLHAYAMTMLKDEMNAEEMVQQVFFKLWDRADHLNLSGSIAAYLYRAVHNECLNYLKHLKVRSSHQLHVVHRMKNEVDHGPEKMMTTELESKFRQALNELPEQCRTIFQLSRFEELKYREIAERLNISIKTVENQMGKALKLMRVKLVEFLSALILFLNI